MESENENQETKPAERPTGENASQDTQDQAEPAEVSADEAEDQEVDDDAEELPVDELSKCTVMVVDDTEENIDILVETLGDDYEVSVATDGETAIHDIKENMPDLVLLDIMMPGIDGYEVCQTLKEDPKTCNIPIIFVTAVIGVEGEKKGLDYGAIDYITKPISPPVVQARVKNHLQLRVAQMNLEKQNDILQENARLRESVERMTHHDLKTPLNSVLSVPDLLVKDKSVSREQAEMLQMIKKAGLRMLEIINRSMDMCKMEAGEYQLNFFPVDLLSVLNQISGELQDIQMEKSLSLDIVVEGRLSKKAGKFTVLGEEMLYYTMLANLMKNAYEASPKEGSVKVFLEDKEEGPSIQIYNKGEIPKEIESRFFEKFATFGKKDGTGLGTYSAKLTAEVLGGQIGFRSSQELGTTVTIELPAELKRRDTVQSKLSPEVQEAFHNREITVLVVDDYEPMRRTITSIIKQMGFQEVISAANGQIALGHMSEEKIDLIISDLNMPKMNGLELLKHVRMNLGSQIPFIMVTGAADKSCINEAIKLEVSQYVIKPFHTDALMKKINALFEG